MSDVSIACSGRCDDGSDETLISPRVAETAVLKGIGRLNKIDKVVVQVALKECDTAQQFSLSRSSTVPRVVMDLAARQLALLNVKFLVADAD